MIHIISTWKKYQFVLCFAGFGSITMAPICYILVHLISWDDMIFLSTYTIVDSAMVCAICNVFISSLAASSSSMDNKYILWMIIWGRHLHGNWLLIYCVKDEGMFGAMVCCDAYGSCNCSVDIVNVVHIVGCCCLA